MAELAVKTQGMKRPLAKSTQQPAKKNRVGMTQRMKQEKQLRLASKELCYEIRANYINFNTLDQIFEKELYTNVNKKIIIQLQGLYAEGQTYRLTCDLTYAYRKIYPLSMDVELIRKAVQELQNTEKFSSFMLTDEHLQMDDGSPEITDKLFNELPVSKQLSDEIYFTKNQLSRAVEQKADQITHKIQEFNSQHSPQRRTRNFVSEALRVVDCMLHKMNNEYRGIIKTTLFGVCTRQLNDIIGKPITVYFEPRMVSRDVRTGFFNSMGATSVQLSKQIHNLAMVQFDNIHNFIDMLKANGTMLSGSRLVIRAPKTVDHDGNADLTQDCQDDSFMEDDEDYGHFERENLEDVNLEDEVDLRPDEY